METLLTARQSTLRDVAGACTNSQEFRDKLNEATRRLLRRGDWPGTVVRIMVCVRSGCIVWPRYVGTVREVNLCDRPLPIGNLFKDFILDESLWRCGCGKPLSTVSFGRTPVFDDVRGDGRYICAFTQSQNDIGKTVRIFGVDNGNQPLYTRNADGTRSDGIVLTLQMPFAQSTVFVRRIDRVVKEITQSNVQLYALDSATSLFEDIAVYEPGETNPDYERHQLRVNPLGGCTQAVTALVKLHFIPVLVDTDLVLIDNLDALLDMMMSIDRRKAGDIEGAAAFEASSINELNRQLEDRNGSNTVPISMGELGNTRIGRMKVF